MLKRDARVLGVQGQGVRIRIPFLLCGVITSPLSYADTQTIELICELDVTTQRPDGHSRQSHETAAVELLLDAATGFKAIRVHSVAIPVAVANKQGGAVTSFVDHSNEKRWDISNRRDRSKVATEESATYELSSGYITAYSIAMVGDAAQRVEARGSCAKGNDKGR